MKRNAKFQARLGLPPQRRVRRKSQGFKEVVRNERGSTAVEFAVILPVFLLLVFSLIDFGRYFYTRVIITNASIEVASAITRGLYAEGDSVASKNQKISAVLQNVAPDVAGFSQLQSSATLTFTIPAACPNSSGTTTVNISTPFASISPITTFLSSVSSQSTLRCIR
jgi:Flp pilus assembly protein TadG